MQVLHEVLHVLGDFLQRVVAARPHLGRSPQGAAFCMSERPGLPSNWLLQEPRLPAGSSELPVTQESICSTRQFWMELPFWSVASWKWMPPLPWRGSTRVVHTFTASSGFIAGHAGDLLHLVARSYWLVRSWKPSHTVRALVGLAVLQA